MLSGGLLVLFLSSFLPIWKILYKNEKDWADYCSLWTVIRDVNSPKMTLLYVPMTVGENDFMLATAIFCAGCVIGAAAFAVFRHSRSTC
jgi:hypothetical protein